MSLTFSLDFLSYLNMVFNLNLEEFHFSSNQIINHHFISFWPTVYPQQNLYAQFFQWPPRHRQKLFLNLPHTKDIQLLHTLICFQKVFVQVWFSNLCFHCFSKRIETARCSCILIKRTWLDFQTRFALKLLPWPLSSRFQYLVYFFDCNIPLQKVTCLPFIGILVYHNWQKLMLVLTGLENHSHISSALLPSFSRQRVNR